VECCQHHGENEGPRQPVKAAAGAHSQSDAGSEQRHRQPERGQQSEEAGAAKSRRSPGRHQRAHRGDGGFDRHNQDEGRKSTARDCRRQTNDADSEDVEEGDQRLEGASGQEILARTLVGLQDRVDIDAECDENKAAQGGRGSGCGQEKVAPSAPSNSRSQPKRLPYVQRCAHFHS
jgi:hypothetical protein